MQSGELNPTVNGFCQSTIMYALCRCRHNSGKKKALSILVAILVVHFPSPVLKYRKDIKLDKYVAHNQVEENVNRLDFLDLVLRCVCVCRDKNAGKPEKKTCKNVGPS